jgi:hypothetical protein
MKYKEVEGVRYYKSDDEGEEMSTGDIVMCVVFVIILAVFAFVGLHIIG